MTRGHTFYINEWFNKGVRLISDLVDLNGNIYQFQRFKDIYGVRGTFLDYQALITKIPNRWKNIINENKPYCITNAFNTTCSIYTQNLIEDKKGCRRFYDSMVGASEIIFINKWEREIGYISNDELLSYNLVIKELKEVALKDFRYHKLRKTFSKFYRRHYELVSKFNVGLKTLLHQGLSEPEFYGDLVYKFKKIVGRVDFCDQFRKIIVRYKRIGYNINIMRQSACIVFNPITVYNFASLFNCTPVGRASDSMMAPT